MFSHLAFVLLYSFATFLLVLYHSLLSYSFPLSFLLLLRTFLCPFPSPTPHLPLTSLMLFFSFLFVLSFSYVVRLFPLRNFTLFVTPSPPYSLFSFLSHPPPCHASSFFALIVPVFSFSFSFSLYSVSFSFHSFLSPSSSSPSLFVRLFFLFPCAFPVLVLQFPILFSSYSYPVSFISVLNSLFFPFLLFLPPPPPPNHDG